MHDVFISHAYQDKPLADAIQAKLEERGISCFRMSHRGITSKTRSGDLVPGALLQSQLALFIVSSSGVGMPNIKAEQERAARGGKPTILLQLDDLPLREELSQLVLKTFKFNMTSPLYEKRISELSDVIVDFLRHPQRAKKDKQSLESSHPPTALNNQIGIKSIHHNEYLEIIKQGVDVWNKWREGHANAPLELQNIGLQELDLHGINLSRVNLHQAKFNKTDLSDANLQNSDLSGANLFKADLSRADLHKSDLSGANLEMANLTAATLTHANLSEADLKKADLSIADLSRSHLCKANLLMANLTAATLRGSDVAGANFRMTDLTRANLTEVDLAAVDLTDAKLDEAIFQKDGSEGLPKTNASQKSESRFTQSEGSGGSIGTADKVVESALSSLNFREQHTENRSQQTHDVFISYATEDKQMANAICNKLEADRIRCWIAPRDTQIGDYAESIVNAIKSARVFVLVLSQHSNLSFNVRNEVGIAANQEVIIIPFKIREVDLSPGLEFHLINKHWIDAVAPPCEEHIQELIKKIRGTEEAPGLIKGIIATEEAPTNHLETLEEKVLDDLAKAAHDVYCEGLKERGYTFGRKRSERFKRDPFLVPYSQLPEEIKEQNRDNVRDISVKLSLAGYIMIPSRGNERPFVFSEKTVEMLADAEQERWLQSMLAHGWSYAEKTDNAKKHDEFMIPWSELPEKAKKRDRDLVRGIPDIIARAGYAIVKSEE